MGEKMRYKITLNRVHDLIEIREENERLPLRVDADPLEIVRTLNRLQPRLMKIQTDVNAKQEADAIAREFCDAIFGSKQTQQIFDLYNGDCACVLGLCSKYFGVRLGKLIAKAQKRANV
jgi:hypothetical protein